MTYRLHLSNGSVFEGKDERDVEDLLTDVDGDGTYGIPDGWAWVAGLYVRVGAVIAIETVPA